MWQSHVTCHMILIEQSDVVLPTGLVLGRARHVQRCPRLSGKPEVTCILLIARTSGSFLQSMLWFNLKIWMMYAMEFSLCWVLTSQIELCWNIWYWKRKPYEYHLGNEAWLKHRVLYRIFQEVPSWVVLIIMIKLDELLLSERVFLAFCADKLQSTGEHYKISFPIVFTWAPVVLLCIHPLNVPLQCDSPNLSLTWHFLVHSPILWPHLSHVLCDLWAKLASIPHATVLLANQFFYYTYMHSGEVCYAYSETHLCQNLYQLPVLLWRSIFAVFYNALRSSDGFAPMDGLILDRCTW